MKAYQIRKNTLEQCNSWIGILNSLDLNIIEMVWDDLNRECNKSRPVSEEELWHVLWQNYTCRLPKTMRKLAWESSVERVCHRNHMDRVEAYMGQMGEINDADMTWFKNTVAVILYKRATKLSVSTTFRYDNCRERKDDSSIRHSLILADRDFSWTDLFVLWQICFLPFSQQQRF